MTQYIDKDAVVAEIKRLLAFYSKEIENNKEDPWAIDIAKRDILQEVLSFINNLEVKEVDYERELSKYVSNGIHRFFPNVDDDYCKMDSVVWQDYVIETAKHFFELGIAANNKAQKGE